MVNLFNTKRKLYIDIVLKLLTLWLLKYSQCNGCQSKSSRKWSNLGQIKNKIQTFFKSKKYLTHKKS